MPDSLLKNYLISPERYDEMVAVDGQPRSHWRPLLEHLGVQDDEVLDRRIQFIQDALETDGVSYNIYGDVQGTKRLWELDALPLLLSSQEWATLSEAVAQRATLLDAVLGDLYGDQNLVAEGFLPPALVYGQRAFKWPCVGHRPPSGHFLQLYAVDVARAPDGHWWVIADRTQGPSGAGYALQNRIILSRAFPDAFRELQVEPLADFSAPSRTASPALPPTTAIRPWSYCSRRAPTTRPTSSTPSSPATSAFPSWKARI